MSELIGSRVLKARIQTAKSGEKYVTLEAANGEVLMTSEMYSSPDGADEAVERLQGAIPGLEVVDDTKIQIEGAELSDRASGSGSDE